MVNIFIENIFQFVVGKTQKKVIGDKKLFFGLIGCLVVEILKINPTLKSKDCQNSNFLSRAVSKIMGPKYNKYAI